MNGSHCVVADLKGPGNGPGRNGCPTLIASLEDTHIPVTKQIRTY